jgi:alpha-glucuronidase
MSFPISGASSSKADSEGQPGPHDYGRTQADGANMLAEALAAARRPRHLASVRLFGSGVPVDRIRQAYDEFRPLDGTFADNVMVQVKNGPLDFQPASRSIRCSAGCRIRR